MSTHALWLLGLRTQITPSSLAGSTSPCMCSQVRQQISQTPKVDRRLLYSTVCPEFDSCLYVYSNSSGTSRNVDINGQVNKLPSS
uniref:Secreted protein n=1 Tax=Kalanchoe fedtschenkoi TaxID=63787 RepID=A0A7N0U4W5_KALFE